MRNDIRTDSIIARAFYIGFALAVFVPSAFMLAAILQANPHEPGLCLLQAFTALGLTEAAGLLIAARNY